MTDKRANAIVSLLASATERQAKQDRTDTMTSNQTAIKVSCPECGRKVTQEQMDAGSPSPVGCCQGCGTWDDDYLADREPTDEDNYPVSYQIGWSHGRNNETFNYHGRDYASYHDGYDAGRTARRAAQSDR